MVTLLFIYFIIKCAAPTSLAPAPTPAPVACCAVRDKAYRQLGQNWQIVSIQQKATVPEQQQQ